MPLSERNSERALQSQSPAFTSTLAGLLTVSSLGGKEDGLVGFRLGLEPTGGVTQVVAVVGQRRWNKTRCAVLGCVFAFQAPPCLCSSGYTAHQVTDSGASGLCPGLASSVIQWRRPKEVGVGALQRVAHLLPDQNPLRYVVEP